MNPRDLMKALLVSVFATVLLGPLLLYQLFYLAPAFLFYSMLAGWAAYVVAAVGVAARKKAAFYGVAVLALAVLALSLPQPEHYSFFTEGDLLAAATFVVGDALQVCVLVIVPLLLMAERPR